MKEEIKCPKCNSSQIYNRAKSDDYRCVKCGNIFIIDKQGKKK